MKVLRTTSEWLLSTTPSVSDGVSPQLVQSARCDVDQRLALEVGRVRARAAVLRRDAQPRGRCERVPGRRLRVPAEVSRDLPSRR